MRRAAAVGAFVLLLISARDAGAACLGGGSTQTVSSPVGNNLYDAMRLSTSPCTISVGSGTYQAPGSSEFTISAGITVRPVAGASVTLQVAAQAFAVVAIWPIGGSCPSGATLEGFTLTGGSFGVFVGADPVNHPGCGTNQITGVTLRNLIVNATVGPGGGNGLTFSAVQNSVIDSCTIASATASGIVLGTGSNNNIVMNNTINANLSTMGIAIQTSNDNMIVGNTIAGSSFDGIILNSSVGLAGPGSSRNRIERNTISGYSTDGILVNDSSLSNYVGFNVAVSNAFDPVTQTKIRDSGTGLWINNNSNGNYVYGNDFSGAGENGIDVLTSKSTFFQGNAVHGNFQGGIWIANVNFAADPAAPAPQDTVLQGNFSYFNTRNAQVFFQGATNSQAAYNYFSGAQGVTQAGIATSAVFVQDSPSTSIYENTVSLVGARALVQGNTAGTLFFRNRFVKGTGIPNPPQTDGKNGVTYVISGGTATWDAGSFLGGNHWSDHAAASGNPDPSHPYTNFIGTPNVDRFPFQSEQLQLALAVPNSVSVVEPVAGSALAAATKKSIRWVARGCALVDIYYGLGSTLTLISRGFPNIGTFVWAVPAVVVDNNYFVRVVCANSDDTSLGVFGDSPLFTIASANLQLMTPGRAARAANGGTLRVAWKKSASISSVNVFVKSGTGAETSFGPFTSTFADITLPSSVSNSSRVTVRIQNSATSQDQDSVDGYFMVRGTSPAFTTALGGLTLQVGSVRLLEWVGLSNSYLVDLDLVGGTTTSIARNLPDFGTYTWFVADASSASATIRATFKDANGTVLTTVNSGAFAVARNTSLPPPTSGNRAPALHDFDGDAKTELTVFRPANGTWYVRYSTQGFNPATASAFQWGLPGDLPISGDFDGDGKIELTVFRPSNGTWYVRYSSQGFNPATADAFQWGLPGDIPMGEDFDGDGRTDLTVFRPSNGTWYVRYSSLGYSLAAYDAFQWGLPGDLPQGGDFDGDGRSDLTVFRPSSGFWFIRLSSQGFNIATAAVFQWGLFGDVPLIGDFDGDGRSDLTVFRPSSGMWFIRLSSQLFNIATAAIFQWGLPGDIPFAGDFEGDGRNELTVFRPSNGTWYVRFSSQAFDPATAGTFQWGLPGDVMVK